MQIIDADATRAALPFDRLVEALRERFKTGCETPTRHVHEIANPLGDAGGDAQTRRMTSLLMPAWVPGRYYGVKIINIAPGNAKRGLPGLHGSYLLFDARTGVPATRSPRGARQRPRRWVAPIWRAKTQATCWWWARAGWRRCCQWPGARCARSGG